MIARALSATPWGIDARLVEVEVDARNGFPSLQLIGLADAAVKESRDRVRSAIKNSGLDLQEKAVVINLAPADLRKEGNHLDLAIALALLVAHRKLPESVLVGRLLCGELGLDGSLRPIRGSIALAELGDRLGLQELLLPEENAALAAAHPGAEVRPIGHLRAAVEHLRGERVLPAVRLGDTTSGEAAAPHLDLCDVRGQSEAKRALEVAAAGGHNLLLSGPPGTGKTMLARRLPGLLPPLEHREALEVAKIWTADEARSEQALPTNRPFRSPHSSSSVAALVGGGAVPRPGEISLAHRGVLFLDEFPEFRRDALEALRQPLEDGTVTIVRAQARLTFPATFALVAAMNPCPCGFRGDSRRNCRCSPVELARYRRKLSGPLLDRIDLHVEVPAPTLDDLRLPAGETSDAVRSRVVAARQHRSTLRGSLKTAEASASGPGLLQSSGASPEAQRLVEAAYESLQLSTRALTRVLTVGRTLAHLEANRTIEASHVAEALSYREAVGQGAEE